MTSVLEQCNLKVEIFTVGEDGFVLGLSRMGFEVLGGSGAPEWREIICDASQLSFQRGGTSAGISNALDVGTLLITLVNSGDPMYDPGMVANIPIRVSSGARVLFTGAVENITTRYDKKGNVFATLSAVDRIRQLAQTPQRGDVRDYRYVNILFPRVSTPYHAIDRLLGDRVPYARWPGGDWYSGMSQSTPTLTWTRWGTTPQGVVEAPISVDATRIQVRDDFVAGGSTIPIKPFERGIMSTLTGLTPGVKYHLLLLVHGQFTWVYDSSNESDPSMYALGVLIDGEMQFDHSHPTFFPQEMTVADGHQVWTSFVATGTTQVIALSRDYEGVLSTESTSFIPENYTINHSSVRLWETRASDPAWPVEDVLYESTLFNHINLVCDSAGLNWWVNSDNELEFSHQHTSGTVVARFSDVHDPADPLHACYNDISASFDTQNTVNVLEFDNHALVENTERRDSGIVQDEKRLFIDSHSVGIYDERLASVHTRLGRFHSDGRAAEVLEANSMPEARVSLIRVNMKTTPLAHQIDLYSTIEAELRGVTGLYHVVGIQHEVHPDGWMATFTLRKL